MYETRPAAIAYFVLPTELLQLGFQWDGQVKVYLAEEVESIIASFTAMQSELDQVRADYLQAGHALTVKDQQVAALTRHELKACQICQWPRTSEPYDICPCCGHEPGADEGQYAWDGKWWSKSRQPPQLVIKAETALAKTSQQLAALRQLVNQQAEDAGLWFMAHYASEAYLQEALRALHATIESPEITALRAEVADIREYGGQDLHDWEALRAENAALRARLALPPQAQEP